MSAALQTAIVLALVAGCALSLAWRAWRTLAGKRSGCGCASCPAVKRVSAAPARAGAAATAPVPVPVSSASGRPR
jgi:hypothetical protein